MGVCLTIMVGYTRKGNNKGIIFVPEITYKTDKMLSKIYEDLWENYKPFIADHLSLPFQDELDNVDGFGDKLKYYRLDHFLQWIENNLPELTSKHEVYYGNGDVRMESTFENSSFQALYQMLKAVNKNSYVLAYYY